MNVLLMVSREFSSKSFSMIYKSSTSLS